MPKLSRKKKAFVKITATPEGLQKVGYYLSEGRRYMNETSFGLKQLGFRKYASIITDYWKQQGVEEEFFRTRIFRLEHAGTENGTWEVEGDDLKFIAPFTYDPERGRPLSYAELLLVAVQGSIDAPSDLPEMQFLDVSGCHTCEIENSAKESSSVTSTHYGWKLLSATLASSLLGKDLTPLPDLIEQRTEIRISLTDLKRLLAGEYSENNRPSPALILAVFSARLAINPQSQQPYSVEDALAIASGHFVPINPLTGQPFTSSDLAKLGIKNGNNNPTLV